MDFVETVLLRKAGRGRDMLSSAPGGWHHQHQQSPLPPSSAEEEEPCAATDRGGGLLWEDFSVDDLLDLGGGGGGGKEQNGGAEGEGFLQVGEVEEEEEERAGWCNSNASPSTSALSFQAAAFLPSSSDPIVPVRSSSPSMARSSSGFATEEKPNLASLVLRQTQAGDVEDLEWVSRFVDDSYSEFASAALAPPFANLYAPAPPAPAAAAEAGAAKAWSTSSGSPLKRPWRSSCFSTASVAVPARARSKRSRTGGRVWSLRGPSLLSEPSSSSCSSASSSSSCSVFSSVTSSLGAGGGNPDRFLHSLGGGPLFLNQRELPQLQVTKKKTGRKPKVPAGGGGGGAEQETRRRCSHCGVDKTPQWRAGPMGTKTLCNACGVRYKSGRLWPEYRPAGSPTFLSHIHSNSHRKVLEIRRSKEVLAGGDAASCSPSPSQQVVEATRPYGVV